MRTFILLTIVALAVASPIDDKKTPDISSLPLKKDDSKNATGKVIDSYTQDGIHATPLHKRDTQQASSPTLSHNTAQVASPKSGQQVSTPAPQSLNKNQQPLINNQRQSSSSLNNQRPLSNSNTKAASTPSTINQQKSPLTQTDPIPPRPLSQSNVQPNLASSSRVRRDAPRPTDQKTSSLNTQQTSTQQKSQQLPVQQKSPQVPAQKTSQVTPQQKSPSAAPAKVQTPVQGSRVTRDAPKPVDTKTQQLPVQQKSQQVPAKVQTPVQGSRVNRDSPKPVDTKTAPQPTSTSSDAKKVPAPVADKSPVVNSRKTREAPNPHEQSKIVPSSSSTGAKLNKDTSSLNPVVSTKSTVTTSPLHKRESPASNVRGDSQSLPSSSSNNQSPQFVHPVPVDHILKKQEHPAATPALTVTKTDSVHITPSLPTTETKTVEVTKVDAKH